MYVYVQKNKHMFHPNTTRQSIYNFRLPKGKYPNIPPGLELFPGGFGIKLPLFLHKPLGARGVRVKTPREAQGKVRQELPGLLEI